MKKQLGQVFEFQKIFNQGINETPTCKIKQGRSLLRFHLMQEENEEYLKAVTDNNLVEVADALGDMLYVLCGTIIEHGFQYKIEEIFDEIHKSNMSKLDRSGNVVYSQNGKVLKGENYFKPNIEKILNK